VECVQKVLKHPVNHVLIQHYRDGNDYISEHSDKTLDIVRGSKIVNVSLGAQRTMVLRTKKDAAKQKAAESTSQEQSNRPEDHGPERTTQRIPLPHNSMFVLGLETNKRWLHGIRQDRREKGLKTAQEMSHNGERISLTFRHIGTFLLDKEKEIWGQGAVSKSKAERRPVVNGDDPETQRLIEAFGSENHQSDFDWDAAYGGGFDVLHFVPQLPKLFFTKGDIGSMQVRMCLLEKGIVFTPYELEPNETSSPSFRVLSPRGTTPVFVDVDPEKTMVCEALSILQHIEMFYPSKDPEKFLLPSPTDERAAFSRVLQHMQESEKLHKVLESDNQAAIDAELEIWDARLFRTKGYLSGSDISLDDIAVWPVLENYMKRTGLEHLMKFSELDTWYRLVKECDSVQVLSKEVVRDAESETEGLENIMASLKLESEVKET
jgi:glutathione S-transferase